MLVELCIRNLAVIESVRITFQPGFQVLTGETGAGKSIVIDALSLLAGSRGSSDLVRHGCEKAEIEGSFDLSADHPVWTLLNKSGIDASEEELLIIRREISTQGKSACRINGQMVNQSMLREIGEWLVNIHGQHEHQSLLKTERHLQWLDEFGHITQSRQQFQMTYKQFRKTQAELEQLKNSLLQKAQMLDLYRFQIDEISAAQLQAGEEQSLEEDKQKLSNVEKLLGHTTESYEALYGPGKVIDLLAKSLKRLEEIAAIDRSKLAPLAEQIQNAYYQLEDAAYQLRDYKETIEFHPEKLDQIEHRLNLLTGLRRKYGGELTDILTYMEQIKINVEQLENTEEHLAELSETENRLREQLKVQANNLSKSRAEAAIELASAVEAHLADLHMAQTKFCVSLSNPELTENGTHSFDAALTADGWDRAEFLISPNPGEPLRPLAKIASGGELSRMMLAMKTVFAAMDRIPVVVFDEVDTGVSGKAAQAIAEKLRQLSGGCQIFAITHLPQVACMADSHYSITKKLKEGRTYTEVMVLNEEERVQELARLLVGAEMTQTAIHHAREMLKLARDSM